MKPLRNKLHNWLLPRFQWHGGNRFVLHANGSVYFPRMLQVIALAQHNVELEMYLVNSGHVFSAFRDALIAAAARGVRVRVLLDHFGSLGLNGADRQLLAQSAVQLTFYNRLHWRQGLGNLLRNHRKLLLVDSQTVFTGGAGLTDEFAPQSLNTLPWHDVMLEIHGPVVNDWQRLFELGWSGLLGGTRAAWRVPPSNNSTHGPQLGRVAAGRGPRSNHVMQALYSQLQRAQLRAWMVTPYFMPPWKLRRLLIRAAQRGVDVRVLVPGPHTDHPGIRHASRRHYTRLLRHGVKIFEYQQGFNHTKLAICDEWVTIGSTNFDRWNLRWNLDANQEVADAAFNAQVLSMVAGYLADSTEIDLQQWRKRAWYLRAYEVMLGRIERWISRFN